MSMYLGPSLLSLGPELLVFVFALSSVLMSLNSRLQRAKAFCWNPANSGGNSGNSPGGPGGPGGPGDPCSPCTEIKIEYFSLYDKGTSENYCNCIYLNSGEEVF